MILLHPADDGGRRQFLFEHLAGLLPGLGVAVLRYDRRAAAAGRDVPYLLQAEDLSHARDVLTTEIGPVPTGLWGFSQGAWVALLAAAAGPALAFLTLVGCSAVSPARQMRYGTAQQLRQAGFPPHAIDELSQLRAAYEDYQRGHLSREHAQQIIGQFADRPWFPLSWVPAVLPSTPDWDDMDFDPAAAIRQIRCPVLAFYGDDEWVPVAESIGVWQDCFPDPAVLSIHELPGTRHHPTLNGGRDVQAVSPEYTAELTGWLDAITHPRPRSWGGTSKRRSTVTEPNWSARTASMLIGSGAPIRSLCAPRSTGSADEREHSRRRLGHFMGRSVVAGRPGQAGGPGFTPIPGSLPRLPSSGQRADPRRVRARGVIDALEIDGAWVEAHAAVLALGRHQPDRRRPPTSPRLPRPDAIHIAISEYDGSVARASTTSDVFNAIAEASRRQILDALMAGEKAVGAIVDDLSMPQPQVSRHLRVLSEVGLVKCRARGRHRLYSLEPARLRPLHDWLAQYEQMWNERLDRIDDYLKELQQRETSSDG